MRARKLPQLQCEHEAMLGTPYAMSHHLRYKRLGL
jgi:hypothetical protein